MEILKDIQIIDLGLFLEREKILVIADLHIGYEESLNKEGVLMPRFEFRDIKERLNKILKKVKAKKIIINGDLKHEFGEISDQEWRESLEILDLLLKNCKEVILVKGNHDTILGPIAKKKGIEIVNFYKVNDKCILHGDKILINCLDSKILIVGHEHAAISLKENVKVERFKCFLKGKWKNKELIVMPSFNMTREGTNVLKERLLSPFLKDIENFEVYIIEDKVYRFGKIKDLR